MVERTPEQQLAVQDATYCAYCGARFHLDDKAATFVTEHIYTCEKHPMRIPERQRDDLLAALEIFADPASWASQGVSQAIPVKATLIARAAIAKAKG